MTTVNPFIAKQGLDIVQMVGFGVGAGFSIRLAKFLELPEKQIKVVEDVLYASFIGLGIHQFATLTGAGTQITDRVITNKDIINGTISTGKFIQNVLSEGPIAYGASIAMKSIVADTIGKIMVDLDMMSSHLAYAYKFAMNSLIIGSNIATGLAKSVWKIIWGFVFKKAIMGILGVV